MAEIDFVKPIRNNYDIEKMKKELLRLGYQDYMLFVIGINTGLRLRNILPLKVSDVKDKPHVTVNEIRTGKTKRYVIEEDLKTEIDKYIQDMGDDEYLLRNPRRRNKPYTKIEAYRILNIASKNAGLGTIGTHTMRKTFGYHYYKKSQDIKYLQELFNQSAPSVTLHYIGHDKP